jgi:flagellar assembly protein FliH
MATIVRHPPPVRRVEAPLVSAHQRARVIAAAAADEAARVIDEARREAEELRRAARDAGYEEGLARASGWLAAAVAQRDRLLAEAEPELVDLALAIARRVVGAAAEREAGVALESASRVLAAARGRRSIALHVHPDDAAEVRRAEPRLAAALGGRGLLVVDDASVGRGGARVVTEAGTVDGRLELQLEALRHALLEEER